MSAIDISRGLCCCFTGHRPDKLNMPEHELREALKCAIDAQAMLSVDVCAEYFRGCFMRRNEWMVAHSARLIAVFNGTHGGTHATILRALRSDLDVHAIMI